MSNLGPFIIAEVPVVTTAAFAGLAWLINRAVRRIDRHETRLDEHEAEQAAVAAELGRIGLRVTTVETLAAQHERRIPSISENLAILATFMDRHERWHERHDDPHSDRG